MAPSDNDITRYASTKRVTEFYFLQAMGINTAIPYFLLNPTGFCSVRLSAPASLV
jgi:hypothetical protein